MITEVISTKHFMLRMLKSHTIFLKHKTNNTLYIYNNYKQKYDALCNHCSYPATLGWIGLPKVLRIAS